MPLPLPQLAGEGNGTGVGGVNERPGGEGKRRGVEGEGTEADKGDDEQEFQRIDEMVGQLRGGDIEAQCEGRREAEDGGAAQDWVDADEQANGDAPCQFLRRGPHAEEREDGKRNTAVGPVVVEQGLTGLVRGGIHGAGVHYSQDRLRSKGLCWFWKAGRVW